MGSRITKKLCKIVSFELIISYKFLTIFHSLFHNMVAACKKTTRTGREERQGVTRRKGKESKDDRKICHIKEEEDAKETII